MRGLLSRPARDPERRRRRGFGPFACEVYQGCVGQQLHLTPGDTITGFELGQTNQLASCGTRTPVSFAVIDGTALPRDPGAQATRALPTAAPAPLLVTGLHHVVPADGNVLIAVYADPSYLFVDYVAVKAPAKEIGGMRTRTYGGGVVVADAAHSLVFTVHGVRGGSTGSTVLAEVTAQDATRMAPGPLASCLEVEAAQLASYAAASAQR